MLDANFTETAWPDASLMKDSVIILLGCFPRLRIQIMRAEYVAKQD